MSKMNVETKRASVVALLIHGLPWSSLSTSPISHAMFTLSFIFNPSMDASEGLPQEKVSEEGWREAKGRGKGGGGGEGSGEGRRRDVQRSQPQ